MKELHRDVLHGIGSMKDRMALAMIEAAEADGRLRTGGSVVLSTPAAAPECLCPSSVR